MNVKVTQVTLEAFVQATESLTSVKTAILNAINNISGSFTQASLTGHYGNPILFLQYQLDDPTTCVPFLVSQLAANHNLQALLERSFNHKNWYIRLDKQAIFLKQLIVADTGDVIRIRVSFSGQNDEIISYLQQLVVKQ